VVVDRIWSEDIKSSITHSEHGASPEKSGGSHPAGGPSTSDHESLGPEGFWNTFSPIVLLRWRIWPAIVELFSSSFADEKSEVHYAQVWRHTLEALCSDTFPNLGKLVHQKIPCIVGVAVAYSQLGSWLYFCQASIPGVWQSLLLRSQPFPLKLRTAALTVLYRSPLHLVYPSCTVIRPFACP